MRDLVRSLRDKLEYTTDKLSDAMKELEKTCVELQQARDDFKEMELKAADAVAGEYSQHLAEDYASTAPSKGDTAPVKDDGNET